MHARQVSDVSNRSSHAGAVRIAEVRVAERVRRLRTDKSLTLRELAEAAGLSQAFLSRVENHKAALTIAGLERVAAALGAPMAAFFEDDTRTLPITVVRAGEASTFRFRGPSGFVFEMLASSKKGKLMEPLIVDLSTAKRPMPLKSHPGEEFDYVLEGQCTLHYGTQAITLKAGDGAYYDATVPHAARPVGKRPCRILAVVASREYLFHGDLTKLLNAER